MNWFTAIVRGAVGLLGAYLILVLSVGEFNAMGAFSLSGGSILASGQHLIAALAFLAGGIVLVILAVAPKQISAVVQFIVHLGRV